MSTSTSASVLPSPTSPLKPLQALLPTDLPDVRTLTTPEEISARLALIARRETDLTLALNALVSDRSQIETAFRRLRVVGTQVGYLAAEVDGESCSRAGGVVPPFGASTRGLGFQNDDVDGTRGEGLVERIKKVWETSERVGGKVRKLDTEISRVKQAVDIVTEVMELKNALETCSTCIVKEDWESASRACKRAMSIRKDILEGGFAGTVIPTAQQSLPPPQTLQDLRNTLLHTFRTEFDAAAQRKDQQAVSRFFRLWPGIDAEEEGLEAYGDFVVDLVKTRNAAAGKPSAPMYYLTQLTSLLEAIAHIIDQHQPVVEKYYGNGRMRKVVRRLVEESDRVLRNLVEGWEEERRVGRLIAETKTTKFPLLTNPSILPPLFPTLANPATPQLSVSSIANTASSHLNLNNNISAATSLLQSYAPGSKRPQQAVPTAPTERTSTPQQTVVDEEPSGPDPKDVDKVLGELVALGGRWAMFRRFVDGRLAEDPDLDVEASPKATAVERQSDVNGDTPDETTGITDTATDKTIAPSSDEVLEQSGSHKAIQNLLRVYYEPLELWFLRSSIEKAHCLDSPETSSKPLLSSMVDDTFYLINLVLNRILSCGSLSTLRSMRQKLAEAIERDYMGIIRRKMEGVYAGQAASEREKEKGRDQRLAFIIYLNDLDVSADYMDRVVQNAQDSTPAVFLASETDQVREELQSLGSLSTQLRSSAKTGLEQLFNQLTRPRLRSLLDECYKDTSYLLDDDAFAEAEEMDIVRKRFQRAWEGLVDGYRDNLTDHNYQIFFSLTVETLVRPWEKVVMGMRFTELGAIRYDRDIRGIANYLSTQTNFGGVREKFTRLQQIGTVLNMDQDEDPEEFYSNSGIPWRISKAEYNAVLEQRQ